MGQDEGRGDNPNAMQVGGTHYLMEYQVWDFTEKHGLGVLEACIIKYVCRWRNKGNGVMDLEKAIHYVDKLIDLHRNKGRVPKGCASINDAQYFSNMQDLNSPEEFVVVMISRWSCHNNLIDCRDAIKRLIKEDCDV